MKEEKCFRVSPNFPPIHKGILAEAPGESLGRSPLIERPQMVMNGDARNGDTETAWLTVGLSD